MKFELVVAIAILMTPLVVRAEESPPRAPDNHYVDLQELIDRVAKRTGKTFIVDPRVRADVPLAGLDPAKIDYPRLLAILRVNLFVAVEVNGVVSVVPDANARQLPVPVYSDLKFKAADDELVNVLLTLKNACSGQLVPVLRPLMPQAAHLAADIQSNTLIIDDRAANVRRIGEMTERLDRAAPAGQKCQPTTAN